METGLVLGLDFGGTKIAAAVADHTGRRLKDVTVPTQPERGAQWNFERGIDAARDLVAEPVVVCACTFGIPGADGVELAPAIDGWEELAIGRELEDAFPDAVVRLATDVKAAAEAEVRFGALAGYDPAIYLNLGTGLAVGLVCGGRVIAGANGAAGEIGYSLRSVGRDEQLEDVVSGTALAKATSGELSAEDVFARSITDIRLARLVSRFVEELSFHLVNLTVALDPARIAVGGGMTRSWDRLEGPLRRSLEAAVPFPPELVLGDFPFDAALVGALALAVDAAGELQRIGIDRGRSRA